MTMEELTDSPLPTSDTAAGREQQSPSAQRKRPPRKPKNGTQRITPVDGTVSDSVANLVSSPRPKQTGKQRNKSVNIGALPGQEHHIDGATGQNMRPVSKGEQVLPATPLKEQAYAGPTFQASPAPSSLPVPKFFSKALSNPPVKPSFDSRLAGGQTPERLTPPSEGSDERASPNLALRTTQTPLDMFFQADKAERERRRSNGGSLSPTVTNQSPRGVAVQPSSQRSSHGGFVHESSGEGAGVASPGRQLAARCGPAAQQHLSPQSSPPSTPAAESERRAYTQSLKDLLFTNLQTPPTGQKQAPPTEGPVHSGQPEQNGYLHTPSPNQRPASRQYSPANGVSAEYQSHYSLHYGNRNLSPLFKAAKNDSPKPSTNSNMHQLDGADFPNFNARPSPSAHSGIPVHGDPIPFGRSHSDQHVYHASQQPPSQHHPSQPTCYPPQSSFANLPQSGAPNHQPSSSVGQATKIKTSDSPRGSSPHDIRTMEDDLRRMLNLNVLSN